MQAECGKWCFCELPLPQRVQSVRKSGRGRYYEEVVMARSIGDVPKGEEVIEPVQRGHLKDGELHLVQTVKVRKELSEAAKARYARLKLKAVNLDWNRK
ncbi:hypothetical protein [Herbaspirillum sp. ST 5-3]|uniref:hypothetical protein n=1 Tax=Oxalobacteraceae TaxID=75682 RepID=UPI0010A458B0|nr:hypothetical protein [Herbaspirillum sp. ST 5-3]